MMQSYEKISRKSLKALLELAIEMRSVDGNFDANKLIVLISIARKNGIEATKIAEAFGIPKGTMSNVVLSLSPYSYRRGRNGELKDGLGLVVQEPSMNDRRAKELHLTLEGKQFIDRLIKILQDK
ncbi:DNA-binding transcriptional regulator, MarR family [Bartonella apis]|uniref:MarR family winged helix-turn-helix transcriptional regulator n=1 Tax=Bartonella apis TaxID=1686310 RepID=UPI00095ADE16|nr:hypothetical protein [Bartonella apis]OLY44897.1 DNA-binding transcriptional regulator, MarR family [Bartonella apis]